jgi:hypothetical protein
MLAVRASRLKVRRGFGYPHRGKLAGPIPVLLARRESGGMKRTLFISMAVVAILVLAVGGWTVRGVRWAVTG